MAPRGVAWRIPELRHLVQLVGEHMPATEQQWEEVQELHEGAFPHNRSITALSNKFKDLYRMKMPTGDPKIPDYVQRAKEIHREFIERTDGSVGAADDVDDDDEDSNVNGDLVNKEVEDEDYELANFFDAANGAQFNPPSTNVPNNPPLPDVGTLSRSSSRASNLPDVGTLSRSSSRASNRVTTTPAAAAAAAAATTPASGSDTRRPRSSPLSSQSTFVQQVSAMGKKQGNTKIDDHGMTVQSAMMMMMMQQNQDRVMQQQWKEEDRLRRMEREFQEEKRRSEREEQTKLEREERLEMFRLNLQQQAMAQQANQQMMTMMMTMMTGTVMQGNNKRHNTNDGNENDGNESYPKKSRSGDGKDNRIDGDSNNGDGDDSDN